jgi:hypothetical protein
MYIKMMRLTELKFTMNTCVCYCGGSQAAMEFIEEQYYQSVKKLAWPATCLLYLTGSVRKLLKAVGTSQAAEISQISVKAKRCGSLSCCWNSIALGLVT